MGSSCTKHEDDEDLPESKYIQAQQNFLRQAGKDGNRMMTVGMLAAMAHQAGGFMNQMALNQDQMDPLEFRQRVKKAKAEMRTVTIRNDCLYIDYEYVGRIPDGMAALAY